MSQRHPPSSCRKWAGVSKVRSLHTPHKNQCSRGLVKSHMRYKRINKKANVLLYFV